jgi:hypothetical protein
VISGLLQCVFLSECCNYSVFDIISSWWFRLFFCEILNFYAPQMFRKGQVIQKPLSDSLLSYIYYVLFYILLQFIINNNFWRKFHIHTHQFNVIFSLELILLFQHDISNSYYPKFALFSIWTIHLTTKIEVNLYSIYISFSFTYISHD